MVGREGTQCMLERYQWLFLLRRGAYKSPEGHPRMALGYFLLKALLIYPPPAKVVRLHGRDNYVVILILEMVHILNL